MFTSRVVAACVLSFGLALTAWAQDPPKPQDKPKEPEQPKVELMALFKNAGTTWSYRIVKWHREGDTESATETVRVARVEDYEATIQTDRRNKLGNSSRSEVRGESLKSPDELRQAWADPKLPRETLDVGFRKFLCAKHSVTKGGEQTTTWVSTEIHPLIVKQVVLAPNHSEIRTLTGYQSGEVDPWLLYRMPGRSWTVKNTTVVKGMDPSIIYTRTTVKEVREASATISMAVLDQDKKPFASVNATESQIKFEGAPTRIIGNEPPEPTLESRQVGAGDFECRVYETAGAKSWLSSHWPMLVVYVETAKLTTELVDFDLGHDAQHFYRRAGNSYTLKSTTKVRGKESVSSVKQTVITAKDGEASVTMTNLDENGKETGSSGSKVEVAEKTSPLLAYAGQKEELVSTPAGKFPAILTEPGEGIRVWTWHDIVVRMEMKPAGMELVTELTELKLE